MARCTARTQGGKPCKASAMTGSKICIFHATQQSAKRMNRQYGKIQRRKRSTRGGGSRFRRR